MAAGSASGTAWQDGARRVLEYAIAASLALHGLALLSLPLLPSPQARSVPVEPPLEARLVSQQPVAVQPPPPPAPMLPPLQATSAAVARMVSTGFNICFSLDSA